MAKPLRELQPRSSITKYMNANALQQVNAPIIEKEEEIIPPSQTVDIPPPKPRIVPQARAPERIANLPQAAEKIKTRSRDFLLTPEQDSVLEDLVSVFRLATGSRTNASHIFRAALTVMKEHLPSIREEAHRMAPLKRPSNVAGNGTQQWKEFEEAIAETIARGLKR